MKVLLIESSLHIWALMSPSQQQAEPYDGTGAALKLSVLLLLLVVVLLVSAVRQARRRAKTAPPGTPTCEVCKLADSPLVPYRYYYPVESKVILDIPTQRQEAHSYSSDAYREVAICDRCVSEKRGAALVGHALGFIVSLPLVFIAVGILGVFWFASGLLKLRTREQVGDILAFNWRANEKFAFNWMGKGNCLTRHEYARLKKWGF